MFRGTTRRLFKVYLVKGNLCLVIEKYKNIKSL